MMIFRFIVLLLFLFNSVLSKDLVLDSVSYLKPNSMDFSPVSKITIRQGKIIEITPSQSPEDSYKYVVPSMCDAFVTLGADSLGGANNREAVHRALKSFLYHGFTHIQSVSDGPWIYDIQKQIQKGKILGPEIIIAEKPIIAQNKETQNIPKELYFVGSDKRAIFQEVSSLVKKDSKIVHLFHRFYEDGYSMDSFLFYRLNRLAQKQNKILMATTFGDRISILEVLRAGIRHIGHPIPSSIQGDFNKIFSESIYWSPSFLPYYFLELQGKQKELQDVYDYFHEKSKFFQKNYSDSMKSQLENKTLAEEEIEEAQKEFASYWEFFKNNPALWDNLILSGNSGSRFSFPGIGGLMELKLYSGVIGNGKKLLKIPTQNTCSFLSASHSGTIREGEEANLLILQGNPLENFEHLFEIEYVILKGKKIERWKL
ncbi:MAG: hypothetical protein H7A23_03920 [Leptospiraceae bacterium]|nr:hypothetical protein [Leptospiraceae bacterium]